MKHVFILSFFIRLSQMSCVLSEVVVQSDNEELYYSEIKKARESVISSIEEETGFKATDILLLNCTRALNDNL